jgi:hypothetical protein
MVSTVSMVSMVSMVSTVGLERTPASRVAKCLGNPACNGVGSGTEAWAKQCRRALIRLAKCSAARVQLDAAVASKQLRELQQFKFWATTKQNTDAYSLNVVFEANGAVYSPRERRATSSIYPQ